jgi:hypothetical protein
MSSISEAGARDCAAGSPAALGVALTVIALLAA